MPSCRINALNGVFVITHLTVAPPGQRLAMDMAKLDFSCAARAGLPLRSGVEWRRLLWTDHSTSSPNRSLPGRQLVKPNSLRCLIQQILLSLTSAPDGTVHNFNFSSLAHTAALVVTVASLWSSRLGYKVLWLCAGPCYKNSSRTFCQILINLSNWKRIIPPPPLFMESLFHVCSTS